MAQIIAPLKYPESNNKIQFCANSVSDTNTEQKLIIITV